MIIKSVGVLQEMTQADDWEPVEYRDLPKLDEKGLKTMTMCQDFE